MTDEPPVAAPPTPGSSPCGSPDPARWALVFSGGGIRFATHAGVMAEMDSWELVEDGRWLDKFKILVGTSAGALYAGLYASGYTPREIVILARIFADRGVGSRLFDLNISGAAAAYLQYDARAFLGAFRGEALLRLLETVLHVGNQKVIKEAFKDLPLDPDPKTRGRLRRRILELWDSQRGRERTRDYYAELIDFGHVAQRGYDLFLIGTNALTGQKTVFCRVSDTWQEDDARDSVLWDAAQADPGNPQLLNPRKQIEKDTRDREAELQEFDPNYRMIYRRFDQRTYWQFDRDKGGKDQEPGFFSRRGQLPVAIAIRASASIPGVFEPVRIRRGGAPPGRTYTDAFVDGGVDDNLSLSVAADPCFGRAKTIFGVGLSNFGYRTADPYATSSVTSLLLKMTEYMGDAVADFEQVNRHLEDCRVTVLDAMPTVVATLQDTDKIGDLIKDGQGIAAEFRRTVNRRDDLRVDEKLVFPPSPTGRPERGHLYVSNAARAGTDTLWMTVESGALPEDATIGDVVGLPSSSAWLLASLSLFLGLAGLILLLGTLADAVGVARGCVPSFLSGAAAVAGGAVAVAFLELRSRWNTARLGADPSLVASVGLFVLAALSLGAGVAALSGASEAAFGCPSAVYDPPARLFSAIVLAGIGTIGVRALAFRFAQRGDTGHEAPRGLRGRDAILATTLVGLAYVATAWTGPGFELRAYTSGGQLIDGTFGYATQWVFGEMDHYSEAGRALYQRFLARDYLFIVVYTIGLAVALRYTVRFLTRNDRLVTGVTVLVALTAISDLVEDTLLGTGLSDPARLAAVVPIANFATMAKLTLAVVILLALVISGLLTMALSSKRRSPTAAGAAGPTRQN